MRGCLLVRGCGCEYLDGKLVTVCGRHKEIAAREAVATPDNPAGKLKANPELEAWAKRQKGTA